MFSPCHKNNKNNNKNDFHLNFLKGTVLGDKEQGVGIRVKGKRIRDKTEVEFDTEDQVLSFNFFEMGLTSPFYLDNVLKYTGGGGGLR